MEHEEYLEWMSADLDGELSDAQHTQLQAHLHHCPSCAQLYEELSRNAACLQALDCPLPQGLHQSIVEQLPPQETARPSRRTWKAWASLAACLALVAALGYVTFFPAQPHSPTASTRSNPGMAPAAYTVQSQELSVPGGDTVLLLSQPLTQAEQALVASLPTSTLEGGFQCCVAAPGIAQALMEQLDLAGRTYSQLAASPADGSGDVAIVWPLD